MTAIGCPACRASLQGPQQNRGLLYAGLLVAAGTLAWFVLRPRRGALDGVPPEYLDEPAPRHGERRHHRGATTPMPFEPMSETAKRWQREIEERDRKRSRER